MKGKKNLATEMMDLPLNMLYYICQHPLRSTKRAQDLLGWSFILLTFVFYYLCLMQLFELNGDRVLLFRTILSFSTFTQGLLKVPPLMYHRKLLADLLLARKQFWMPNFSEEENDKINGLYKTTIKMMNGFKACVLFTMCLYYSLPLFKEGLMMPVWIPPYKYAYEILLQYIIGLVNVAGMVGFNCLYITMCSDLIGQFRILRATFINMRYDKSSDCFDKYKRCLRYHDFLLRYVENVQKIFMPPLIVIYVDTISTCCMEVINILGDETNVAEKASSLIFTLSVVFQMGLFCIPSSNLQQEILDTADAIYLAAWEDASLEMQTCVTFALGRAQKVVVFKTVGIVDINNATFLNVFRTTVSFLTLIQQMDT